MKNSNLLKYALRFIFLQSLLTFFSFFYFDNFLIPSNEYRLQIDANLIEDKNRFFTMIPDSFVKIDVFISLFIFLFLVFLYSTKFYTYVNELSFSLDRNYFDEYFAIFLTWTTSIVVFVTFFRFSNLISRGYLLIFLFIVPLILLIFRNTELISYFFGRPVTSEKYITINLKEDSIFRNLRIMTFRKCIGENMSVDLSNFEDVFNYIDKVNKETNLNLIVINFEKLGKIDNKLENYLINLNKKILVISKNSLKFNKLFLSRQIKLSGYHLTYFNNDIQYGSKYILKRLMDIFISCLIVTFTIPITFGIFTYIWILDRRPVIIKQDRVGLHGKVFKMYKFRTMYKDSHEKREDLEELNKNDRVIFKIENDPRIFKGGNSIRKYSLDELPQLINVIKGNMSLVGPRPLFEEDTKFFDENYMRRLNVLPGLTGLLQINERNTSEFETWYRYDIDYINNWSIYLDLKILLQTPSSIIKNNTKGL